MQTKLRIDNLFLLKIACYISLAISLLPAVDYYCPWYVTAVPVLIVMLVTLNKNDNIYPTLYILAFVLLFTLLVFWVVYRPRSFFGHTVNYVIAFLPCLVARQVSNYVEDNRFFKQYLQMAAFFMAITSATTIIGLEIYPMAARELASGTSLYDTTRYTQANIGGYEFIYALVLFIPVMLYLISNTKGITKILNIAILALNIWCVYESQYTIALVCVAVAFLVVLFMKYKKLGIILLTATVLFFLFRGTELLGNLFLVLSENIQQEYVADRLMQMSQFFLGQTISTGTSAERIELYLQQVEAFVESPVWGHNWFRFSYDYVSGHSVALDLLGGAGILGLILAIVFIKKLYDAVFEPKYTYIKETVKNVWILFVIVAVLNPSIFSPILTIAFMCCMCIQRIED